MFFKKLLSLFMFMALTTGFAAAVEVNWSILPTHSPAEPARGNTVTISGQIIVSDGDVTDLRVVGGVDETTIMDRTFALLRSGNTRTLSFTYTARPGSHRFWMNIDPENVSGDVSPTNNLARGGFSVSDPLSRPDLHVGWSSFSVVPTRFHAGDTVTFHFAFSNIGTAAAGPFDVGIRSGGAIVARLHFTGMEVGVGTTADLTWTAACAADNALIVDCDNTISEPNEGDNTLADDRLCCNSSWHDSLNLYLENIRPDTGATPLVPSGGPTTVSANLIFTGGVGRGAMNVRVDMGIVGGATFTHTFPFLTLPGNESNPVSFSTVLPVGSHRVFFEVDSDRRQAEMNEGDNRIEAVIRVGEDPRLPAPISRLKKSGGAESAQPDYCVTITNKAQLASLSSTLLRTLKIAGKLKVTGTPAAAPIKIQATLSGAAPHVPVIKSIKLMPAANAEIPFEFDFAKPAPGKYKIMVEAMITDSNPLDNSDSAIIINH